MKKNILLKIILCNAFSFMVLAPCIAQSAIKSKEEASPHVLSLQDCRNMALDSNKTMLGAELLEQKTKYDKNAMLTNFFPKISAYGFYLYNTNDLNLEFPSSTLDLSQLPIPLPDFTILSFTLPFSLSNSFTVGAKLMQPIFMGGKIVAGYKMTKIGTQMAAKNKSLKSMELIVNVDEAYWTHVKTCKLYDAANSFEETVNAVYKLVSDAKEMGMATDNDLLKVRVQQNNAKLMVSKAQNGMTLSKMNLCHYLGMSLFSDIKVDTANFSIDEDLYLDSTSISNRPDYQLLEMKSKLAKQNVKVVMADYLPQVGVMASYGYTDALTYKGIKVDGSTSNKTNNDRLFQGDGFSLMATVNIPICAWGQGHFKISSAKKEEEIANNEKAILQEKMELEQTMYRFNAQDARLKVELTKSSLEAATASLKSSQDYYEVGVEPLAGLLESQTQWIKANSDYIEAVGEFKLEYTRYLKAIGMLNE